MPFLLTGIALLLTAGVNEILLNSALDTYWLMAKVVLGITVGSALLRIIFSQLSFGGSVSLRQILKETILLVLLIGVAPIIIKSTIHFSDQVARKIVDQSAHVDLKKSMEQMASDKSVKDKGFSLGITKDIPVGDILQWLVQGVVLFIATLLKYMRDLVLAVFISATPLFLYLGIMLGLSFFANSVLSLGATLVIWPILSALMMHFSIMVYRAESDSYWTSFSQGASLIIYALAQLLLPFLIFGGGLMAASTVRKGVADIGSSIIKIGGKG